VGGRENKGANMTKMKRAQLLAIFSIVFFPTICVAQNAQTKAEPAQTVRRTPPPADFRRFVILRQDLFDRNNPNNLRSDYPGPPAQPGQF
jgi:hypothetical protein